MADDVQLLDETVVEEAELDRDLYANFEVRRADDEAQGRHDKCRLFVLDVDVEQWDPRAGASPTSTFSAQFDLSDPRTVVGPGEDCLVCDDPLVAGEVFVLASWDGRVGPAHEDCLCSLCDEGIRQVRTRCQP